MHASYSADSLLQVTGVSGTEIYCTANNDASLGGLLTVFHTERSSDSLTNVQNSLPVRVWPLAYTPLMLASHSAACQYLKNRYILV